MEGHLRRQILHCSFASVLCALLLSSDWVLLDPCCRDYILQYIPYLSRLSLCNTKRDLLKVSSSSFLITTKMRQRKWKDTRERNRQRKAKRENEASAAHWEAKEKGKGVWEDTKHNIEDKRRRRWGSERKVETQPEEKKREKEVAKEDNPLNRLISFAENKH